MQTTSKVRPLAVTAMLSAVGCVLMMLDFPLPMLIPAFVKMDVSELPALLASFSLGPVYGILVCLLKTCWRPSSTAPRWASARCATF